MPFSKETMPTQDGRDCDCNRPAPVDVNLTMMTERDCSCPDAPTTETSESDCACSDQPEIETQTTATDTPVRNETVVFSVQD